MWQQMQENPGKDHEGRIPTETASERGNQRVYWQALQGLTARLQGELLLPGDVGFDAARTVWHGAADRHPALIVRCMGTEDVIAAVTFAREQHLLVSVRSGGHSMVGYGTNDGGIVIDLSSMKAITIDPAKRSARIEPGLTWAEVAHALQPYGLALTSGDTGTVGVGGLMLGGGIGWMVRKHGLTLDHLRAVELVTASGELLRASAEEHADLFWGLRGGGGNFGVVTAFEADLHEGGMVLGGVVFYEATQAESILREYARYAAAAPDELTTIVILIVAPPLPFLPPDKVGTSLVGITVCYTGDLAEGERIVEPLRHLATPLADGIAPMPYLALFALSEAGETRGLHSHVRSLFLKTLNDKVLHTFVEASLATLSPDTFVQLRILGGAMSRVAPTATAFAHRDKEVLILVTNCGPDSTDSAARTQHFWRALGGYSDGVYVNFLADEGEQRIHEAYPEAAYARLVALKNRYDPTNLFSLNQNIKPTLEAR